MKDDAVYLSHILEAIASIEDYLSNTPRAQFLQAPMIQDAVLRRLEVIGEASRNLSDQTKGALEDVDWASIVGLRNRLIHAYFQVDVELIWEITQTDIPLLKRQIESASSI